MSSTAAADYALPAIGVFPGGRAAQNWRFGVLWRGSSRLSQAGCRVVLRGRMRLHPGSAAEVLFAACGHAAENLTENAAADTRPLAAAEDSEPG